MMVGPIVGIHTIRPLHWLLERGCEVAFIGPKDPLPGGARNYQYRRFPELYPAHTLDIPGFRRIARRLIERNITKAIREMFRELSPDITHVHWVDEHAYYCARAGTRPLILTVWGTDINSLVTGTKRRIVSQVRYALRQADVIFVDSSDMHSKCARIAASGSTPTRLLTLGVDTEKFRPGLSVQRNDWRQKLKIPLEATVFLSIRAWAPWYRHEEILRAFASAKNQMNAEAVLVFKVWPQSNVDRVAYEKQMRLLAKSLGVEKCIRWMEQVPFEQLPEVYAMADAIVNYPAMDAFPVTFLEAAACEKQVITCLHDAYKGTFVDGNFVMVDTNDTEDLVRAFIRVACEPPGTASERLRLLRHDVCRRFDQKVVADELVNTYTLLANGAESSGKVQPRAFGG